MDDTAEQLDQWQNDLGELVRKSFVDVIELCDSDEIENRVIVKRYRLHPLMRQYVTIKAGDMAMLSHRRGAAGLFLEYSEQFEGHYVWENYDALESEHGNLIAAVDWAYTAREWDLVKRFAMVIEPYLETRGYWKDADLLLERAIEANKELGDKSEMATSMHMLGILTEKAGDVDKAKELYRECLKIQRKLNDEEGISHTLFHLGDLEQKIGNFDEARKLYRRRLKFEQELGNKDGVADSLGCLGLLASEVGDVGEARRLGKESRAIIKELDEEDQVVCDNYKAKNFYQEGLKLSKELKDKERENELKWHLKVLAQKSRKNPSVS
jgi:tetratricopeptide (TPR) repeat protein